MKARGWLFAALILTIPGCKAKTAADEDATPANVKVETAVAKAKPVRELLPVDGQFVVAEGSSARLAPVAAGKVQVVLVREGDQVHRGQRLAVLDMRVQLEQSQSALSAQAASQAQARQSDASLRAAKADQENQVRIAQSALETAIAERDSDVKQAELDLRKIQSGARPEEVAQAEQAVTQARISRDKAKADRDRDARLAKEGYVSGQQADSSRATFDLADSALKQAQAQLSLVKQGARVEERLAAEEKLKSAKTLGDRKVEQARLGLRQAQEAALGVEAKSQEAASARLNAEQKQADARAAMATAATGEIRAPYDGVIVRRILNPGDSADPSNPVLEIAAKGYSMDFLGQLSTTDAAKVSTGMSVEFSGDEPFLGRVVSVGIASSGGGLAPVRVRVNGAKGSVGAFQTAKIVLRTISQAVTVPKACVVTRDGKSTLFLAEDGKAKLTEVKVGPTDGDLIAILSGVKAGQNVILVGQYELADGTTIEVEKP